ncbi:hypothetical protein ES703_93087 [subsurface metagenome]
MKTKNHIHKHKPHHHKPHHHALIYKFDESKYRWIEDLKGIHRGEEIWVLGCGPSLDDFPDGFFDEKYRIAIAVKWSVLAFPNCTYTASSKIDHKFTRYVSKNRQHLLHKHIIHLRERGEAAKPIGVQPIYMRVFGTNCSEDYYQSLPNYLLNGTPMRYGQTGTLVHWDLQAAIIMGAKKVTAVGCSGRTTKFHDHASKRGMDKIYTNSFQPGGYSIEEQTEQGGYRTGLDWLARAFAPYGIQVARYFYGKGYENII